MLAPSARRQLIPKRRHFARYRVVCCLHCARRRCCSSGVRIVAIAGRLSRKDTNGVCRHCRHHWCNSIDGVVGWEVRLNARYWYCGRRHEDYLITLLYLFSLFFEGLTKMEMRSCTWGTGVRGRMFSWSSAPSAILNRRMVRTSGVKFVLGTSLEIQLACLLRG